MITHLITVSVKESNKWTFDDEVKESFVPREYKKTSPTKLRNLQAYVVGRSLIRAVSTDAQIIKRQAVKFTISKKIKGKSITQKQVKKLLSEGITDVIEGFKGKRKNLLLKLHGMKTRKKFNLFFRRIYQHKYKKK